MKRNLFLMTALCLFNLLSAAEIPEEILKPQYNSPIWSSVTPAFGIYKKPLYAGPFFCGKKIGAAKKTAGDKIAFRKETVLEEKAVSNAWLQYFSDSGTMSATLNGIALPRCGNPSYPEFCNVTDKVKAGTNELSFTVDKCDANVTAELFVRYADGTFSRVSTDDTFACSIDGSSWLPVEASEVVRPLSDENFNRAYFPYFDMTRAQSHFIQGAVQPVVANAGETIRLLFDFQGPIPRQAFPATLSIRAKASGNLIWDEKVIFTTEDLVITGQDKWQLCAKYTMPLYVDSADAVIRLEANEFFTTDGTPAVADFTLKRIDVDPKFAEKSDVEVRQTANGPQFFRNGKPFFALWGGV
ncbi:MAG: hypothetical protein MJ106_05405, partial [Lentisphaeria bacterium]|nr:hypothetical protein [Lentisphaeria bacterium]